MAPQRNAVRQNAYRFPNPAAVFPRLSKVTHTGHPGFHSWFATVTQGLAGLLLCTLWPPPLFGAPRNVTCRICKETRSIIDSNWPIDVQINFTTTLITSSQDPLSFFSSKFFFKASHQGDHLYREAWDDLYWWMELVHNNSHCGGIGTKGICR